MNLNTIFRGPATVDPPRLSLVTAPAVEVWTVADAEVLQALKLDDAPADSAFVTLCLKAARRYFERITGLALITQEWLVTFDDLPIRTGQYGLEYGLAPSMSRFTGQAAGRQIVFPRAPLQDVSEFKYKDSNGTLTTFDPSNYSVASVGTPGAFGRLWLNEGADWPDVGSYPASLQIKFTVGYGDAAEDVPDDIRAALLFLTAHWYENRLPIDPDGSAHMPLHLDSLIEMHRVTNIG